MRLAITFSCTSLVPTQIKTLIIEALDLEDIGIDDIDSEAALFGDGLGLDSIDALELGLALKNKYDIRLNGETEATRQHFYSVATLAKFVKEEKVS
jgi:acyl carrier protein